MKIKLIDKKSKPGMKPFEYAPGWTFLMDPQAEGYDWLVVFEDLPKGMALDVTCPRERTMLLTWEPVSVKSYSRAFTRQFGHMLTNRPREAENHPHYHLGRGYFPWCLGRGYREVVSTPVPAKTKLISTVCSDKRMRQTMHDARFRLTEHLKAAIPELDWFGHGIRYLEHKYDALDAYRYHVAVENHIAPKHWTEKIADPILTETLAFYAGDPELGEVLPPDSFIPIPIDDPVSAERTIKEAIANDEHSRRLSAIREAKRMLLEKYNLWAQIISVVEAEGAEVAPPTRPWRVYARTALRKHNPLVAISDGFGHLLRYLKGGR